MLTSKHVGFPPFALTILEQCKVYKGRNILFLGFVRFLEHEASAALCPLVPKAAIGQSSIVVGISVESTKCTSVLRSQSFS